MAYTFRSKCPLSSALDVMGDKWSLLIIRDMLFEHKKTFKDFSCSEEGIATNILSDMLSKLEEFGIISKGKLPDNKKTNIYRLTEKGLELMPVLLELLLWSDKNVREYNMTMRKNNLASYRNNKMATIEDLQQNYREETGTAKNKRH